MGYNQVELGFLEETEPWRLESYLFPSKIGGKPAWLSLENLPTNENLKCKKCKNPTMFLCQLYAPFEENESISPQQLTENFHRTLFVFICRNGECCMRNNSDNLIVLRNSLTRDNNFYPSHPPAEDTPNLDFSVSKWANLCQICGALGDKKCSKCKSVYYCSKEHQVIDWKEGHKLECESEIKEARKSKLLFTEAEIVRELEELDVVDQVELKKYENLAETSKNGSMAHISEEDLEAYAAQETDRVFQKFQMKVKCCPDQIIRYKRGGDPLWISKEPLPENVPNCEHCNGPRQFEFQIMPQMLSLLKENDLDWGVITVYTCKISCTDSKGYKNEFVFKQDVDLTELQK